MKDNEIRVSEINPKVTDNKKRKSLEKRIMRWVKKHKKLLIIFFSLYISAVVIAFALPAAMRRLPQNIKVGERRLCYVKNEEAAKNAIKSVYKAYLPEGAKLLKYSSNKKISYDTANLFKAINHTVKIDKAASMVRKLTEGKDAELEISVTYEATKRVKYKPDPKYEKSDEMLAGQKVIKSKAIAGTKDITTVYTAVNGSVMNQEVAEETIVKKGTAAVVLKGTLGLPDGEDWKTYNGDPVFRDGEDLVKTAALYKGAPYKHGGTNLKTGVSCVGFVRAIYLKYGIKIGNSHRSMETAGIGVSYSNARPGDIICYRGHVGLYIGNGKMMDATSRRGVGVNTVHPKSIIAVRRIVR